MANVNLAIMRSENRDKPRIAYWLQGQDRQNFGDYLTEYFWQNLADGLRVLGDVYHLLGSVISDDIIRDDLHAAKCWENGRVVFWCCGARDARQLAPESISRSVFCGVRGPLTRD